jgi:hypothetical protein
MFTRGSRYEPIAESDYAGPDGRTIRYKRIRFLPAPGSGPTAYMVQDADRPDLAAFHIAQDPEAYWRLCDANGVSQPADLTDTPGDRLIVPQPGGEG